jgi:hypothetical protein
MRALAMVSFLFIWEVIITTLAVIDSVSSFRALGVNVLLHLGVVVSPLVLRLAPSVTRLGCEPKVNEGIRD